MKVLPINKEEKEDNGKQWWKLKVSWPWLIHNQKLPSNLSLRIILSCDILNFLCGALKFSRHECVENGDNGEWEEVVNCGFYHCDVPAWVERLNHFSMKIIFFFKKDRKKLKIKCRKFSCLKNSRNKSPSNFSHKIKIFLLAVRLSIAAKWWAKSSNSVVNNFWHNHSGKS